MKLKFENIDIERSSAFKAEKFGIGNSRVIMEILRGKMYSNPIQTICQEVMSNARDAHRELGKENVPIEVKLPNKLEPTFWIRDFGPGITPDRMANVFILYGVSTKRSDNVQTGGFGLGAKSPFSYSDTFSVVSVTPEDGKMIRRQYIAHLDETGVGEMSCVQENETDEAQGTTISITPKPEDYNKFKFYTMRAAVFWKVRPNVIGDAEWKWPEVKPYHVGKDWTIYDTGMGSGNRHNNYGYNRYQQQQRNSHFNFNYTVPCIKDMVPYALVDGIPYKINLNHLFTGASRANIYNNMPLRLHFDVGEVSVTANREDIDYQAPVIAQVKKRLEQALAELRELIAVKLTKMTDLREAYVYWKKLKSQTYGNLLDQYTWNNINLKKFDRLGVDSKDGIKTAAFTSDASTRHGCRKSNSYWTNYITISDKTLLVENDTGDRGISRARLATLMDTKSPDNIIILDFTKKNVEGKNDKGEKVIKVEDADEATIKARKKLANTKYHWDLLKPVKLSTIPKKVLPKADKAAGPKVPRSKIIKVKEFDSNLGSWGPADMEKMPEKETKYYVQVSGSNCWLNKADNIKIPANSLCDLVKACEKAKLKITIYGIVPSHVIKLNSTWKPLLGYMEKILENTKKTLPEDYNNEYSATRRVRGPSWGVMRSDAFLARIDAKGILARYIQASIKIEVAAAKINIYNNLAGPLKKQRIYAHYNRRGAKVKSQLENLYTEFLTRYPLVAPTISQLPLNNNSILDDVVQYVNIKDKE